MNFIKCAAALGLSLALVACGGGGGNAGTPSGGTVPIVTPDSPTTLVASAPAVTLLLKNSSGSTVSTVSALDIFTLQAIVKSAAGVLLPDQVVQFSGDPALVKFSSANGAALTDAFGVATVQVTPGTSGGAGSIAADVTVAGVAVTQVTLGLSAIPATSGGSATAKIVMTDSGNTVTTTISALETNTLKATIKDAAGSPLPSQIVNFSSQNKLVKFMPASSALTDLSGVATVTVLRSQTSSVGADTVSAATTVGGVAVNPAALNIFVNNLANGGVPTLTLGLRDSINASTSTVSRTGTTTALIQLTDATGAVPSSTTVTLSGDATFINFPSGATALSDPSGVAKIPVSVVAASPGGASTLKVTASISGSQVTSSFDYQVPTGAASGLPTLALGLSGGGSSVAASGTTVALATIKDASGTAVGNKLVTFAGNSALIKFSPASGTVLTNASGVASIQVAPTSLTSAGASTLTAKATIGTTELTSAFDFQLSAANLGLRSLDLGAGAGVTAPSLAPFGNRAVSVRATVDGIDAINTPVQVTFTSSCGTVTPASVTTDGTGTASSTYTASLATCAGNNVTITASAVGASSSSGVIPVSASIATNVQFVSTVPQLIYLKDSVGTTQAQVAFKVVDSNGNPLQNKKLRLSLSNTATGVSLNTVGNTGSVDFTTDSAGLISAAVFSGTVPTSLNVRATLLDNSGAVTNVFSNSNLLTVASGSPTQRSLSLSREKFSIEGQNVDGVSTSVTLSMADRQGNPVPPGTQVNFVSESGVMLPAVCFVPPVIPATVLSPAIPVSSCTTTIKSSGTRTANGRVSIMAYVAGLEDFVDVNGNNIFDTGDTFVGSDLGRASRDNVGGAGTVGVYDTGEFQVPREGVPVCTAAAGCVGDGVWGAADVRQQVTIIFATSTATINGNFDAAIELMPATTTPVLAASFVTPGLSFTVADLNGNSIPTGSTIVATATDNTLLTPRISESGALVTLSGSCEIVSNRFSVLSNFALPNSLEGFAASLSLKTCTRGDIISIKVTTPLGTVTQRDFVIP
jgi:hypothetical protein